MSSFDTTFAVAPFEHYMLADDTKLYNMTPHVRFWFDGIFAKEIFKISLANILPEQPLWQSYLEGAASSRTSKLHWRRTPHLVMPWIDWQQGDRPLAFPDDNPAIDLRQEIGLRLFIHETGSRTELTITFHHATSDGKSIFTFVEDLLAAYAELSGGPKRIPRLDSELLADRAYFGLTTSQRLSRIWRDMIVLIKFFTMLPMTLVGKPIQKNIGPTDTYRVVRKTILKENLNQVKLYAKEHASSLNDVLLRDLFVALGSWNKISGAHGFGRKVTIAVPVCMRGEKFQTMPASNFVSMHVLHVPNRLLTEPEALLRHIHKVMKFVKSFEMGHTLVVFAMLAGKIPGLLASFLALPVSKATAVLTNLGIPFHGSSLLNANGRVAIPGIVMTGVETLPPIRNKTRIAISINSYDGDLRMTMRYDDRIYDESTAQKILNRFFDRVQLTGKEASTGLDAGLRSAPKKTAADPEFATTSLR